MEPIRAAGAVLWRRGPAGIEVAVVHRPRYNDWSLPKGKLAEGETEAEAALREVAEETGYRGRLGPGLGQVAYETANGPKTVRYWALEATEGAFTPNGEVDQLRWVPRDEAAHLLTYQRDAEVVSLLRTEP